MDYIEQAKRMRPYIEEAAQSLDERKGSKAVCLYPKWEGLLGTPATVGKKFQYNGKLFAVNQPHTFSDIWIPSDGTESLYREIPEWFAGTREDPVPYEGNMELELGKFYTQNGVMYECIRSTGAPVYDTLEQLSTMMGGEFVKAVK